MLVTWLVLLSACLFFNQTCNIESVYSSNTKKQIHQADYDRLLRSLYQHYKSYKQVGLEHDQNDQNDRTYRPVTHGNLAQKRSALRDAIQSVIHDVTMEEVTMERKALRERKGTNVEKQADVEKRDIIEHLHVATPIHDDMKEEMKEDVASKRGLLPPTDMITVHDDDTRAVSTASKTAVEKNIVPVLDVVDEEDDDAGIESNGYSLAERNGELEDDLKTFITVVKKTKFGDDIDEYEERPENGFHGENMHLGGGMFDTKAMNSFSSVDRGKVTASTRTDKISRPTESPTTIHELKMPGVSPQEPDTYLCYAHKLPKDDQYIVEYRPLADKQTAHHMLLYACAEPFRTKSTWNCREMSPVCKNGVQTIMYAWAMNAPSLKMPTDVGFHVGGTSGFKYLVLQVHYLHVAKFKNDKVKDSSGLEIVLDKTNKRYLAGIYLLADGFTRIPPHKNRSHIDMGCFYSLGPEFTPFRFRVHAHKLGVVITGYRVRNNTWTLIGRGDPQRPQAFYPVFHDINIKQGDFVMGRCTYNSYSRNSTTRIGPTHDDEMCNFYIMYFYDSTMGIHSTDSFPCEEVTSEEIYNSYPKDSDIALNAMEEGNRMKFARFGAKDLSYIHVKNWPYYGDLTVGQISGVAMLPNDSQLVILHRADRYWDSRTFDEGNIIKKKYQTPIAGNTMIWMDRLSGNIKKSRGKNMFFLPHGITIDRKGFIWVTDVGSHQVYKMTPDLSVVLTLGEKFLPGSSYKRFCKPTDVAVMPNGDFFVGDGYCNNRVLKFNKEGEMLLVIAADRKPNIGLFPEPNFMLVVHSVSVDPIQKRLFVADRENGRILVFHATDGVFIQHIKAPSGAVYAVAYNPNQGGVLHFVTGPSPVKPVNVSGYTYSFISNSIVSQWAPDGGFTLPHDLTMTKDNLDTFVVEINPFKVWKFTQKSKSPRRKKK